MKTIYILQLLTPNNTYNSTCSHGMARVPHIDHTHMRDDSNKNHYTYCMIQHRPFVDNTARHFLLGHLKHTRKQKRTKYVNVTLDNTSIKKSQTACVHSSQAIIYLHSRRLFAR